MAGDFTQCPICNSPGDVVAAPRHVRAWTDLTGMEQVALLAKLGEVLGQPRVSFESSDEHGHFHIRRPSTPKQVRLTTGEIDPLLPLLAQSIDGAKQVDLAVAFAMESGVRLIEPWFKDLLERGGRLRIVLGDYLDVTEPPALWRLSDLTGAEVRVFETGAGSFHPKAWLFRAEDGRGAAMVGSSNLSQTALTKGVEWNLHSETGADAVETAFESLWKHPKTKALSAEWITAYAARRRAKPLADFAQQIVADEPLLAPPEPHEIQHAALTALRQTRDRGHKAGLVVLATGLGKTWTAAFDSQSFARVLFVAHREEILNQAMSAFRRIRPEARLGRFDGVEKDADADILFASIQTLGRAAHLRRFSPDAFDYIIVDEFHHAAAASYRGLLDHFTPHFLLGLTATPDRSDGADLLALCGENLVYNCDLFDGITAGLLSPFSYLGVPDEVNYAQIPWRSSQFDPAALEAALATVSRAANALDQFRKHGQGPAIGFCCSMRHADFMAEYFCTRGLRAVAVHSGPGSAPRTTSLEQLGKGEIDILFAVDMFNEGVDVPEISTVLMLRPTESVILWLQQLGRGLRRRDGKLLKVVDYIGNHRIFLTKLRALLAAGPGDKSLTQKLDQVIAGTFQLPPGCDMTYDLKVIETLRSLLRPKSGTEEMEAQYRDFRLRHDQRPTASEMARMGFDPRRSGHGGWFDFVRDMGDIADERVLTTHGLLLREAERPVINEPALQALQTAIEGGEATDQGLASWAFNPLFRVEGKQLILIRADTTGQLPALIGELLEWRLAERNEVDAPATVFAHQVSQPSVWRSYSTPEISAMFGENYQQNLWQTGIKVMKAKKIMILLANVLDPTKPYPNRFLAADTLKWYSQNQTKQAGQHGRVLSGKEPEWQIHLFVRRAGRVNGKAAPFLYCGQPNFDSWEGEQPITLIWKLPALVPEHLRKSLAVPLAP